MSRQIRAETIGLARSAQHDDGLGVNRVNLIDEFTIVCCKSTVLGVVEVVIKSSYCNRVSPVVDAMFDSVVICLDNIVLCTGKTTGVSTVVGKFLESEFFKHTCLITFCKGR